MWDTRPNHPLVRLFSGLTEHAFLSKFGIADPPLVDYLSGMLARFVHSNDVFCLRGADGRELHEVAEMVHAAEGLPDGGRTKREYFRHIGDFALFYTGVYPEAIRQRMGVKDAVVNYTSLGKRSYRIAGTFNDESFREESPVLCRLAAEFEICALGLREVRAEWEDMQHHPGTTTGMLIQ